jgi:shikimate dehydrogenase
MKFYLLGYPVGHSVSPLMHKAAFKKVNLKHLYSILEVPQDKLETTINSKIRSDCFGGANVTIPYKIEIIKYMDEIADSAKKAHAVNTIEKIGEKLIGHNTDSIGGHRALTEIYGSIKKAKVVLLGAGGAANALATELAPNVKEMIILNRSIEKAKILCDHLVGNVTYGSLKELYHLETADILINTTPVGMFPNTSESPINSEFLHSELFVYDIVYNPSKTQLLLDAEKKGAKTLGGLWMLVYQGVEAFKIWTGIEPCAKTMYNAAKTGLEVTKH